MASSENTSKTTENSDKKLAQLKQSLPKHPWFNGSPMYLYQGFWSPDLDPILAFQTHFQAQDTDILITSSRKAGTTWLKSLIFSICNRKNHPPSTSPLLEHNPHELVRQFESIIYRNSSCPDLSSLECPRLFATHIPFQALPSSIKSSKCKIIYIFRNPLDTMISSCLFYRKGSNNQTLTPDSLDMYTDMFTKGRIPFGPFEDHALGYWKQSLENPDKVLFIKYEELKEDAEPVLIKIAEFVESPFSAEEESKGAVEEIIELCSFEKLKQVAERNKSARVREEVSNDSFFRRGVVGDWVNYITPSMAINFNTTMEQKFKGSGLIFM